MTDSKEVTERGYRALENLLRLAKTRNYIIDDKGLAWCPVSVNTDAPDLLKAADPILGTSFRAFLKRLYFPGGEESDLPFSLSEIAARIIKAPENAWLKSQLIDFADSRYRTVYLNDPTRCFPDERACFDRYVGNPNRPEEQVLAEFLVFDYFHISQKNSDTYFFVPTRSPCINSNSCVVMPRSGASGATQRVNRTDMRHFIYLDVGAWSSPQTVPATGSAAFGMISPDEIALWDCRAPRSFRRHYVPGSNTMVANFINDIRNRLPGELVFYARFFGSYFETYRLEGVQRYWNPIPVPFTNDRLLFFIPDLHLHLFPKSKADNFVEPKRGGQSLAALLLTLFDLIEKHVPKDRVELYQVGDCYELWESALMLCLAQDQELTSLFTAIGRTLSVSEALIGKYREDLRQQIKDRGLDKIFSPEDIHKLQSVEWDTPSLRPIWEKMRDAIQRAQVVGKGKDRGRHLFKPNGHINANIKNWYIVGGNHDGFVIDGTPVRCGVNNAVFFEHGHLGDRENKPENMRNGLLLTSLSLIGELKGVGDEAKSMEKNRRADFIENAAKPNLDPTYPYRKPSGNGPDYFSVVLTGHTHHRYAALMREHPAFPGTHETVRVFHEEAWPTRPKYYVRPSDAPWLAQGLGLELSDIPKLWLTTSIAQMFGLLRF